MCHTNSGASHISHPLSTLYARMKLQCQLLLGIKEQCIPAQEGQKANGASRTNSLTEVSTKMMLREFL